MAAAIELRHMAKLRDASVRVVRRHRSLVRARPDASCSAQLILRAPPFIGLPLHFAPPLVTFVRYLVVFVSLLLLLAGAFKASAVRVGPRRRATMTKRCAILCRRAALESGPAYEALRNQRALSARKRRIWNGEKGSRASEVLYVH